MTGAALDRALVAEQLDPLDETHDPVGFVADQAGQHPVALVGGLLEELRRAADARQRVLDLVRQHGAERRDRARGAAVGELTVHLVGDGALLEGQHDDVAVLAERRREDVDDALAAEPRPAEVDAVLADARAAPPHLVDEAEDGRAERHDLGQLLALHDPQRQVEEGLGRHVGVEDRPVRPDGEDRKRQRVDDEVARRRRHAAARLSPAGS